MKVLFVADFGIEHNSGGAQRTNDLVIQKGIKRDHIIDHLNYDTNLDILNNSYDVVISNNLEHLSRNNTIISYLLNHPKHVRYEHDSNSYLTQKDRYKLFGSTVLNIFLSKFHLDTFKREYGNIFHNTEIVTSPISSNNFYDQYNERQDKTLYIGFFHYLKGTNKFIQHVLENPNENFVVAGWGDKLYSNTFLKLDNVSFLGKVSYDAMPILYNRYKRIYYHPVKFEPFCRSIGEAILCGMDTNCSDNIGAVHDFNEYGRDGLKEMCNNAPNKFWDLIESL